MSAYDDAARTRRLDAVGPILVSAFRRQGLDGVWGLAFARQESDFNAKACNTSAGDAKRGYSWGLCQMSLQTAKESLGYRGDGPGLCEPSINAALAAKFCRKLLDSHPGATLGDIAALYNSGRMLERAPNSTRTVYVPRILTFAREMRAFADAIPDPLQHPDAAIVDGKPEA